MPAVRAVETFAAQRIFPAESLRMLNYQGVQLLHITKPLVCALFNGQLDAVVSRILISDADSVEKAACVCVNNERRDTAGVQKHRVCCFIADTPDAQ